MEVCRIPDGSGIHNMNKKSTVRRKYDINEKNHEIEMSHYKSLLTILRNSLDKR